MLNKIDVLGSSSKGNAYVLHFDNKIIQLDCGIKNNNHEKVNLLLVSHLIHRDHCKYINQFEKTNKMTSDDDKIQTIDNVLVVPKVVPHVVKNNSYIIEYENEKILYLTDCGDILSVEWPQKLYDLTYLFIEVNWDYFLINHKVIPKHKHGDYSFGGLGHSCNLDVLNFIAKHDINKDCKIIFLHKSSHHANYNTTYKMFESLPHKTKIAKNNTTIYCKSWKEI